MTRYRGDSALEARHGPDAWPFWRRAAAKRGAFLYERLVACGGEGVSVRHLGGGRAGEMRIGRFLHNPSVTLPEMISTARGRTCAQVAGRHVLAIQDTSSLRVDENGIGLSFHPVLAVDADTSDMLGLVGNFFLARKGGESAQRKQRPFADKDSHRWLAGAQIAETLRQSGAHCVTVVEDREGDIYESFALKPAGVEKLVRAAQDRCLADDSSVFSKADEWPEAGRASVSLPAAPGRPARDIQLSLKFGPIEVLRPKGKSSALPPRIGINLVVARELDPPEDGQPAMWLLLTTHRVENLADARRIVDLYRKRWIIEQLFRTMKTKGFDIEALRQDEGGPLEKLVTAILIAAITVMQLVAERDGRGGRPLTDSLPAEDQPLIERVCQSVEGKTEKQKNPHAKGTLAYAAWVLARLGGWTAYYGKPGPIVMLRGFTELQRIRHAWALLNV